MAHVFVSDNFSSQYYIVSYLLKKFLILLQTIWPMSGCCVVNNAVSINMNAKSIDPDQLASDEAS